MKKIKYLLLGVLTFTILSTGCLKKDNLEGIDIITTVYPIEFVTSTLYGDHSIIHSIYPDAVDTTNYMLSEKDLRDYSKKKLFIYNRITNDKDIALELLDLNPKMLIIDATYGMEIIYGEEELWLNPSNLIRISQNIRNGLQEFLTNNYLEKEIDDKYEELKVRLSELDAELKLTAENATRKLIVVNSDSLKYLEKYGFQVISLDTSNSVVSNRVIEDTIQKINDNEVKHIILLENKENSEVVNQVLEKTEVETYTFRRIDSITDSERDEKDDYFTIMNANIELLRNELY